MNATSFPSIPPEKNLLSPIEEYGRESSSRKIHSFVTFHETVKVYAHIHIRDMPERIVARTWYSAKDLQNIKEEVHETTNASLKDSFRSCPRGLEYRTIAGAELRRRNKERAWDAVLDEQDRQWDENITDDEAIAQVYRESSRRSAVEAHKVALQDAAEVLRECWPVKSIKASRCPSVERTTKSPLRRSQISACNRAA